MTQTTPGPDGRLVLIPVQLVDRLAAPMPPPRVDRHRYCGVLARMPAPEDSAVTPNGRIWPREVLGVALLLVGEAKTGRSRLPVTRSNY